MDLTYNSGTAFFNIESPDFIAATKHMKSVSKMIANDVVSFSLTEEVGKIPNGSLIMRDQSGIYARILRNGLKFDLSWGYKSWNENLMVAGNLPKSLKSSRQGLKCLIQTPSGSGDETGQQLYNVTFYGLEILKRAKHVVYESGSRGSVVANLFRDLEVTDQIINFDTMKSLLTTKNSIRQRETSFSFLYKLAVEWGAYFQIGYKSNGAKVGIFIDSQKLSSPIVKKYMFSLVGLKDDEKEFWYNSGQISNVKSFTWQQHIGESGQGDGASISYVGGKMIFNRYVVAM